MMNNKIYYGIIKKEPITKGLSDDKKFYAETAEGQGMFLRVSDISEYDRKKAEYDMMNCAYSHGVLTPQPLGFCLCNDNKSVYSLVVWLNGKNIEELLPLISEAKQYKLGVKTGKLLQKIHTISAPENTESW
jgi:serine/threonine-protein kinase